MDVALAIEELVPAAEYTGSVTSNQEACYDCLVWLDERDKPTWEQIVDAWDTIEERLLWEQVFEERARLFQKHSWRVERHLTQLAAGVPLADSPEKYAELCLYFQELRDLPETYQTPDDVVWPPEP